MVYEIPTSWRFDVALETFLAQKVATGAKERKDKAKYGSPFNNPV